jgi:HlyD family secretion protein
MNTSFLLRRVLPVLLVVGAAAGLFFWKTQAKPVAVVLKSVDRGKVEATVVNTRAGTVEACQRTKLSTIMPAAASNTSASRKATRSRRANC